MRVDSPFVVIESLIAEGRYRDADEYLHSNRIQLNRQDRRLADCVAGEIALELGFLEDAATLVGGLAAPSDAPPYLTARACRIAARAALSRGRFVECDRYLQIGTDVSQQNKLDRELAALKLVFLNYLLQTQSLETFVSTLPEARRITIRAGHPHLLVELHLRVAQCEARRNAPSQAFRHFAAAEELLTAYPNVALSAILCLDKSAVEGSQGDLHESLRSARRASELADASGHFRTRIGAAINTCHLLSCLGELVGAERTITMALQAGLSDLHLHRGALDSLANVRIATGDYTGATEVLDQLSKVTENQHLRDPSSHWETLGVMYSRARLAISLGQWSEAVVMLSEGASTAAEFGDRHWQKKMLLMRAMCLAGSEARQSAAQEVLLAANIPAQQLELTALEYGALAAAVAPGAKSQQILGRSLRIAHSLSHTALQRDLLNGCGIAYSESPEKSRVSPDLDSAVALLELGAYTHVLGPEALAVVDGAGCATAAALVATGPSGSRIVDARGWDERRALAAARHRDGCEVIPLGDHRDEAWELIVEPRPELEHRATLIAIRKIVGTALSLERYRRDEKQRAALWPTETLDADAGTIWASEQTAELLTIARRIAPTPLSVLLTGETGTGKEMLAHAIHRASDRASRTFLPFNCTAVPRDMLDSQLFGYRKGAFTGADASFPGVIRSAAGGTLFLDEIAEMGPDIQPKLLRFLETHEIHPLGEPHPIVVDVRVIAATNANLERLVAEGRFREDLFYRLNVVRLALPPLRERREEIPPLVQHYLERFGHEQKKGRLTITDETLEYLLLYSWPGNVRQLANEVRRMIAMAEPGAALTPAVLSPEIQASRRTIPAGPPGPPEARVPLEQPLPAAVEALERTMVRHALNRAQGRVEEAARLLGISRKGLFLKRRRWGLSPAAERVEATPPAPASPAGCA